MRISAIFETKIAGDEWLSGKACAFAAWLTPSIDDCHMGAISRARWSSCDRVTGRVEADVFPEFAADVLAKAYRLASSVDFHRVSI